MALQLAVDNLLRIPHNTKQLFVQVGDFQVQERLLRRSAHLFEAYQSLPLTTQWAVTLIVLFGLVLHLFTLNEHTVHDAPSLFTTAGIFFTFICIAHGLWGDDTKHIEETIPTLLEGLKTAFFASVFGIGVALSIKLRYEIFGGRQEAVDTRHEDATMGGATQRAERSDRPPRQTF